MTGTETAVAPVPPVQAAPVQNPIRLNTIGYLPNAPKRASVVGAAHRAEFAVVRVGGGPVARGRLLPPVRNADTDELIAVADFSAIAEPGEYRLEVAGVGSSPAFRVAADVYDFPFYTVARGLYLWRCGTAVSGTHAGHTFAHAACHLEDGWLDHVGGGHVRKRAGGGWHDAGDYNKYTVNTGFSLGVMLQAWDHFGDRLRDVRLDLPESDNGVPDFLNEMRWGVDWMLTMQADDGRAYHKLSTHKFCGFIRPEAETAERYFVPWSSAATADVAAVGAMAARYFALYDPAYADRCLRAARLSYAFLAEHPQDHPADQTGFSTGGYTSDDASRRLWAAAELWESTGEPQYLADVERRAAGVKPTAAAAWADVTNLGLYTYALSKREGRGASVLEGVRQQLVAVADRIVAERNEHGYARPLGTAYRWGANGDVAQQAQALHVADRIAPRPAYRDTALDAVAHLFGRNCYGRSFVTGLGHCPPMHPHDRRSGSDDVADPWPGYLVGGGWPKATDWNDVEEDYRTNEIALNWNVTLVYALAMFTRGGEVPPAGGPQSSANT